VVALGGHFRRFQFEVIGTGSLYAPRRLSQVFCKTEHYYLVRFKADFARASRATQNDDVKNTVTCIDVAGRTALQSPTLLAVSASIAGPPRDLYNPPSQNRVDSADLL